MTQKEKVIIQNKKAEKENKNKKLSVALRNNLLRRKQADNKQKAS